MTTITGAEVLLTCNNTKYPLRVKGTSDKNGYFFIKPPKTLTTYGSHRCRVSLLTSLMATCNKATDLHAGVKGSLLVPNKKPPLSSPDAHPLPYDVFTVGPFAFEPSPKTSCAHEWMKLWWFKFEYQYLVIVRFPLVVLIISLFEFDAIILL